MDENNRKTAASGNWLTGDRIPGLSWFPVSAQMHDHAMTLDEVPARKYYWEAETFVDTFSEVANYYGLDIIMPDADIYSFEIEAMGGKMVYSENTMPTIDFRDPLVKKPQDLFKLKTPNFHRDGRLPFALEYIKLRTKRFQSIPLGGVICGLFSLAVGRDDIRH
jgi:uroporphyrinogen-III decarboxylase